MHSNKLNNLNNSLNQVTKDVIDTIHELTDKYAPIKEVPRSKARQFSKPWITSGILKSIKTKHKMYRSHFFSNDIEKVTIYKKYSNKLNKIKSTSKVNYYNAQFEKCKNNLKATWKLIGSLIKRRSKGQLYPTRLIRNNQTFTNRCEIVNQFNQHFTNVGPNLASSLEICNENPTRYISNSPSSSFIMSPVIEAQVLDLFLALDINKSSINIPNAMIKMAASIIAPVFTVIYNEQSIQVLFLIYLKFHVLHQFIRVE
jgi:hypothetical protein